MSTVRDIDEGQGEESGWLHGVVPVWAQLSLVLLCRFNAMDVLVSA